MSIYPNSIKNSALPKISLTRGSPEVNFPWRRLTRYSCKWHNKYIELYK